MYIHSSEFKNSCECSAVCLYVPDKCCWVDGRPIGLWIPIYTIPYKQPASVCMHGTYNHRFNAERLARGSDEQLVLC
ncbi:hypothetical protein BDA96_01G385600 [Sorghum bicolor]|uniref:Uncharacterized protein n=1 Tax=Sorghum bicolor TaxID=4558 RepID=A0A921V0S9_SORBI|nr:hypothetical protein BDA96_01G385600 [Sorghum bicolor]